MKFSQCQIAIDMDIASQGKGRGGEEGQREAARDRDALRKVATFENTFMCTKHKLYSHL